jgi:hypothetical protein
MIFLEKVQFIIVDLVEAHYGKLKQGNKILYNVCHPFELLLLLKVYVFRFLFAVRQLNLTSGITSVAHHH